MTMTMDYEPEEARVYVVYRTGESYDQEENLCGNTLCLIGVFTDRQRAQESASLHNAELTVRALNEEDLEYL